MVAERLMAPPARTAVRQRLAIIHDDAELIEVLRDIFSDAHHVRLIEPASSMTAIADRAPHMLVIGPLSGAGGCLSSWDIVALARSHRELRDVPIVLLSPELDRLMIGGDQLTAFNDVHVVGMPFELDVLVDVVGRVERSDGMHRRQLPAS